MLEILIFVCGLLIGVVLCALFILRWNNSYRKKNESDLERYVGNYNLVGEWLSMIERGSSLEKNLKKMGVNSVGIYGMGMLGAHCYSQLKSSDIDVKCVIDKKNILGVYSVKKCKGDEKIEDVDAIIITPLFYYNEIKEELTKNNNIRVISLQDVINEDIGE